MEEKMSEEEFRSRLLLAQEIINNYLKIGLSMPYGNREFRGKLRDTLGDDEFAITQQLFALQEELEDLRLTYVFKVFSTIFGKAYIDIDGKTYEEIKEIYKQTGFSEMLDDDESVHLGIVKLVDGYALLSTLSQPFEPFELMYAVKHTKQ